MVLNYVNCLLIAHVFPQSVRCKYEELVIRLKLLNRN